VYKFNFAQGNVDLTLNLANLFGYNHKRFLNPYALVGGGAAFAFNNGAKNVKGVVPAEYFANLWDKSLITPVFRYGLGTDIRLTDRLALNLEVNGNMLSDKFNSKDAPNPDYQYNALIGLKYVFGGKPFRTSAKYLADVAAAEAAASALKAQKEAERLAAEKAAAEKAAAEKAAADKLAAEKAAAEAAADANRYAQINTFFELDSDVISDEEAAKLIDFIQWLNKYDRSVAICGYADVQTGRPKYNMGLSSRRVENVKAFLVEHGVDASRISTDFKGDTVQPFEQNELNRVVIGTVEK
jgi:outer membrane protein OmpA-like peptidoglycan-associated protein